MADMIRQGDVLIVPRESINLDKEKLKEIGKGAKILAYGEKTGHSHTLSGDVTFYGNGNGSTLCQVGREGASLVHQEHGQVNIEEGDYIVILQREYDLVDGTRFVLD